MNARVASLLALTLASCGGPGSFEVRMAWGPSGPPSEPGATLFAEVRELASESAPVEDAPVLREALPVSVAAVVAGTAELAFTAVPNGARRVVVVEVRRGATRDAELLRYGASAPFTLVEGEATVVVVDAGLTAPPSAGLAGEALAVEGFAADEVVLLRGATAPLLLGTDSGVRAEVSGFRTFPADRTLCTGLGVVAAACAERPLRAVATPVDATCAPGGATACRYRLAWDVNTGLADDCGLDPARGYERGDACARTVFVRYFDARGVPSKVYTRAVVLDTAPPRVVRARARYIAGPGNPLATPRAATIGTGVRVELAASEPLRAPPIAVDAASASGGRFTLTRGAMTDGALEVVYSATIAAPAPASGTYTLSLTLADLAGNEADARATVPSLELRTSPPVLVVDQARISYLRAPVMRDRPESLGRFTLPAGPAYFALTPADPLDDTPALAADVLRLGDGPAAALRVWADARRSLLVVPLVTPADDGAWPRAALELPTLDRPRVYLTGVDAAGNESAPVLIQSVWFVGSSARAPGSPHALTTAELAEYPRSDQRAVADATGAASAPDGHAVERGAALRWREYVTPPPSPEIEYSEEFVSARPEDFTGAAVWDPTRGEVLLTTYLDRTGIWAWDGVGFVDRTPSVGNLGDRDIVAMAYDRARGRAVAVASLFAETWTWDGLSWALVPTATTPAARSGHAMAYDEAREEVVLLGGAPVGTSGAALAETWTWDGLAWTRHSTPAPARVSGGLAFDPISRRVLAFGGAEALGGPLATQTWAWDGARWTDVTPSGEGPAGRLAPIMAHDEARGRVVLSGGQDAGIDPVPDTWTWDGARWVREAVDGGLGVGPGAYDGRRGQLIGWGGRSFDDVPARMFGWDGAAWPVVGAFERPPPNTGRFMYYDTARARSTVLAPPSTPGELWGTWRFDGVSWTTTTTAGPPFDDQRRYGVAYDALRDRAVLVFAGDTGPETWLYDGATWRVASTTTTPPRVLVSMAFHAGTGEVVLFGGIDASNTPRSDTWSWDGARWRAHTGPGPIARVNASMAYDEARGRVVMFDGYADAGQGDGLLSPATDTWEWDGARWHDRTPAGPRPSTGDGGLLHYNPRLRRVVAHGTGVWLWDGTSWVDRTPTGRSPLPEYAAGVTYEPAAGSALMFGSDTYYRMWRLEPVLPAVQLAVRLPDDVPLDALGTLVVRGACGGRAAAGAGARLVAYRRAGAWDTLTDNTAPPEQAGALLGTVSDARPFVLEAERALYLQCRAATDLDPEESVVALDYLEARVRYTARPEVP